LVAARISGPTRRCSKQGRLVNALDSAAALNNEFAEGGDPTLSDRGHAAIDWEVHACDEACFVRSEEQGGRCDLLRAAEPPEMGPP